jgi:glucose uptake protein GlcU
MLAITIILFAIAAVFGLMNLTAILKSTSTNKGAVYTHGLFAAAGIVLLIVYAMSADATNVSTSIILFIIAALGGFLLFARDLMKKAGPKWLAVVHGLIAVASFVILLVAAFS